METADQKQHPEDQTPEPSREGEQPGGNGVATEGNPPVKTDDPIVSSGPSYLSDWKRNPDSSMVIETSRIREPDHASQPALLMVPVEYGQKQRSNGRGKENGQKASKPGDQGVKKEAPRSEKAHQQGDGSDDSHGGGGGTPAKSPSLTRMLIYCGVLSLVCGIIGAAGYSYFFGSSKSDDKTSSGKKSDSSKGSSSSKGSDAGKGSDASKGPDPGDSDASKSSDASRKDAEKLLQAEAAWMTAVKELQKAKTAEDESRHSEEATKAVLNFFKYTLLSAGRPGDGSLAEAFWAGGQGNDVTMRKALDGAESKVSETFADRPLAEASVREILGSAFLSLGESGRAVKEYQRALALREAMQGVSHPDTAACRNQLAVAYRLANLTSEAGRLFDQDLNAPARAAALAVRGSMLLSHKQPAEAELKLRESLTIRQKNQPDDWSTFDTKAMLGEALLEQNKFTEAEPLLLSGYQGMAERANLIPPEDKPHLTKALERLVKFYEVRGDREEAQRWRKQLELAQAATNPAVVPSPR
jgi:tetratricopeptide (TPR) repeat protein